MKTLDMVKNRKVLLGFLSVLGIVGATSYAVVLAATPDASGFINACYKNSTKVLRITDPAGNCDANETAIDWRRDGGQIISNRVSVPYEGASNQQILTIPEFGELKVTNCSNQTGISMKYINNTSHNVEAGNLGIFDPGDELISDTSAMDMQLGYRELNLNHIATVTVSATYDEVNSSCIWLAQATISQN